MPDRLKGGSVDRDGRDIRSGATIDDLLEFLARHEQPALGARAGDAGRPDEPELDPGADGVGGAAGQLGDFVDGEVGFALAGQVGPQLGNGMLELIPQVCHGDSNLAEDRDQVQDLVDGLVIKTRGKEVGFQVLVGAAHTLLDSLQVGASGGVLGFAAPAPTICFEIHAAWRDNDLDLARSKQTALTPATKRVVSEMGIPAIKYAMDLNGYYGGLPRLPLLPLSAAQKAEVDGHMSSFRN